MNFFKKAQKCLSMLSIITLIAGSFSFTVLAAGKDKPTAFGASDAGTVIVGDMLIEGYSATAIFKAIEIAAENKLPDKSVYYYVHGTARGYYNLSDKFSATGTTTAGNWAGTEANLKLLDSVQYWMDADNVPQLYNGATARPPVEESTASAVKAVTNSPNMGTFDGIQWLVPNEQDGENATLELDGWNVTDIFGNFNMGDVTTGSAIDVNIDNIIIVDSSAAPFKAAARLSNEGGTKFAYIGIEKEEPSGDIRVESILGVTEFNWTDGTGFDESDPITGTVTVANDNETVSASDIKAVKGRIEFYGTDSTYTELEAGTVALSNQAGVSVYFKVIAGNGSEAFYAVTIEKEAAPQLKDNADMKSILARPIVIWNGTGSDADPKTADISVANAVATISAGDIEAEDEEDATVTFYGTDAAFTTEEAGDVALTEGDTTTTVYFTIKAENGDVVYYAVTITRRALVTETLLHVSFGPDTVISDGDKTWNAHTNVTVADTGITLPSGDINKTASAIKVLGSGQLRTGATYNTADPPALVSGARPDADPYSDVTTDGFAALPNSSKVDGLSTDQPTFTLPAVSSPFTVKVYFAAGADSDSASRYLNILKDGNVVATKQIQNVTTGHTAKTMCELEYEYTGSDAPLITIMSSNAAGTIGSPLATGSGGLRIHDIYMEGSVEEEYDEDQVDVDSALTLIEIAYNGTIEDVEVAGGDDADPAVKATAIKSAINGIANMSNLAVEINVAAGTEANEGKWVVTVTKGNASEEIVIEATFIAAANPDKNSVDTAIGLIEAATGMQIEIANGDAAEDSDKITAIENKLKALTGMNALGVTIEVAKGVDDNAGKWVVTVTKNAEGDEAVILVTFTAPIVGPTEDEIAVSDALVLINAAAPAATGMQLKITDGDAAEDSDKIDAIETALKALTGMDALDVTIEVAKGEDDNAGDWVVTVTKNDASDEVVISVTFSVTDAEVDTRAVAEAMDLLQTAYSGGISNLEIVDTANATAAAKLAVIEQEVKSLDGIYALGVTVKVTAGEGGNAGKWVVAVTKVDASDTYVIDSVTFKEAEGTLLHVTFGPGTTIAGLTDMNSSDQTLTSAVPVVLSAGDINKTGLNTTVAGGGRLRTGQELPTLAEKNQYADVTTGGGFQTVNASNTTNITVVTLPAVKGPFTVKVYSSAASDNLTGGRYLHLLDTGAVKKSVAPICSGGAVIYETVYEYTGTDSPAITLKATTGADGTGNATGLRIRDIYIERSEEQIPETYSIAGEISLGAGLDSLTTLSGLQIKLYEDDGYGNTSGAALDVVTFSQETGGSYAFSQKVPNGNYLAVIAADAGKYDELKVPVIVNGANVTNKNGTLTLTTVAPTPTPGEYTVEGKINISGDFSGDVWAIVKLLSFNGDTLIKTIKSDPIKVLSGAIDYLIGNVTEGEYGIEVEIVDTVASPAPITIDSIKIGDLTVSGAAVTPAAINVSGAALTVTGPAIVLYPEADRSEVSGNIDFTSFSSELSGLGDLWAVVSLVSDGGIVRLLSSNEIYRSAPIKIGASAIDYVIRNVKAGSYTLKVELFGDEEATSSAGLEVDLTVDSGTTAITVDPASTVEPTVVVNAVATAAPTETEEPGTGPTETPPPTEPSDEPSLPTTYTLDLSKAAGLTNTNTSNADGYSITKQGSTTTTSYDSESKVFKFFSPNNGGCYVTNTSNLKTLLGMNNEPEYFTLSVDAKYYNTSAARQALIAFGVIDTTSSLGLILNGGNAKNESFGYMLNANASSTASLTAKSTVSNVATVGNLDTDDDYVNMKIYGCKVGNGYDLCVYFGNTQVGTGKETSVANLFDGNIVFNTTVRGSTSTLFIKSLTVVDDIADAAIKAALTPTEAD